MSEFTRPCIECGKMHDTGLQDMLTGEMLERFEECHPCFMEKNYKVNHDYNIVSIDECGSYEDMQIEMGKLLVKICKESWSNSATNRIEL